jgi:hypothetical protein
MKNYGALFGAFFGILAGAFFLIINQPLQAIYFGIFTMSMVLLIIAGEISGI